MSLRSVEPGDREIGSVVAILIHDMFEDWLEGTGITIDSFCTQATGSWWFNYAEALRCVGVGTVLICTSTRVSIPTRFIHDPTGVVFWVLPAPRVSKFIRWVLLKRLNKATAAASSISAWISRALTAAGRHLASYFSTPLSLLRSVLTQERCSCVLVEEYEFPRFDAAVLLGWMMGLPVFGTFCGARPQGLWRRPLRPLALRLCAGLAICAKCEAERVMARYAVPAEKVALIHYPVDCSVWYPSNKEESRALIGIPPSAQVVIYHGAILLSYKGIDVLLDAWERLCKDRPDRDLRLILIGTGVDAPQLSQILATKRLRGVHWLNQWVHDRGLIRRYLTAADVYAFPSRGDSFGISLIEAMACGLSAVAAKAPGVPDIFENGVCSGGIVVPVENSLEFAKAISQVLDDPTFARNLGQRAIHRARSTFSMDRIGVQLREFLLAKQD